jgi:hypothetical protein
MASVYQPDRPDEFKIRPASDVFIRCDNGGTVRVSVHRDCIHILPINGVEMRLCVVNGCAGVEFNTIPAHK